MKHTSTFFLIGVCGFYLISNLNAQDPEFTQFYANPLYLNPALAGNRVCPRVNVSSRIQWPGIYGTYSTVAVSIDRVVDKVKGGLGLVAINDRAGKGTLKTTGVGIIYSPIINLTNKISISTAMQAGYWQKTVDWSKLTFGDQIDSHRGFVNNTNEIPGRKSAGNFDLSCGSVISSKKLFLGAAIHHILEQNEALISETSKLPRKYTVHAGANISLHGENRSADETVISPNILFQQQGDFRQLNMGMYIRKGTIVGGFWFRGQDSFIILLGMEVNALRLGYSYDVTVSKLTNASAGAHEITLGYQFACKKPNIKYRLGNCPSW